MARPEKPIEGEGPVPDLARALREVRDRAGGPSYETLAVTAQYSRSVLADAAVGIRCPSWRVVEAFAAACGADPEPLQPLWKKADWSRRTRPARRRARQVAPVTRLPVSRPDPGAAGDVRTAPEPDPWSARTPAGYVRLLRALRAWGDSPGWKDVSKASSVRISSSTFYELIRRDRTTLPPLRLVKALVQACGGNVEGWASAWQAITLREFERNNPLPANEPQTGAGQDDGTVHPLKRPARKSS